MAESVRHVRKTDLARNTRQVINGVLRGQTAVVESHSRPEAAILDIVDYRIIRAVMSLYAHEPEIDVKGRANISRPHHRHDRHPRTVCAARPA